MREVERSFHGSSNGTSFGSSVAEVISTPACELLACGNAALFYPGVSESILRWTSEVKSIGEKPEKARRPTRLPIQLRYFPRWQIASKWTWECSYD